MSIVSNNSNYNKVSVKTDSIVELIKELSKLGVFKSKKQPKKKRADTGMDGIKQESDMVASTKSIGGPQMRNLPPIQQITAGMTQDQIEDIQRRNDAVVAALRGEVQQQRLEDIEAQQGQRFADITKLGGIMNPILERFRGSTFPAQAMGDQPIDPFSSKRGGVILLGNEPDVQEERFTETLNVGGPEATEERQTTVYAPEEGIKTGGESSEEIVTESTQLPSGIAFAEIGEVIPKPRIEPQERIRKTRTKNEQRNFVANSQGLPPVPDEKSSRDVFRKYYFDLALATNEEIKPDVKTKEDYIKAIKELLDFLGSVIPSIK